MYDIYLFRIRGLIITENPKAKKLHSVRDVDYNAGADVLNHFQVQWNELHDLAEQNAEQAQVADTIITATHKRLEDQWNSVIALNSTLVVIPQINSSIQDLMDQIGKILHPYF